MTVRSLYFSPEGKLSYNLDSTQFTASLQKQGGLLWVDFESTQPEADEPVLRDVFGFHPLAIDDALQESHVPKIDDWASYLYIVLHSVTFSPGDRGIETQELDIFLGRNYLVTHHEQPIEAINRVWNSVQRDERFWKYGVDNVLYHLTDEVVASYMPVVEQIDEAIDRAEDEVFSHPTPRTLENIFMLKRAALHLRRIVGPQREVLNKLARDDYEVVDAKAQVYFRDVYDHLVRLHDITESLRDLVGGALDTYLSVINNRMNDIMKTLTVITTLFMPISFLTGFFGMNYFQPVEPVLAKWTTMAAFGITMAVMVITPISMMLWMKRRGWM